MKRYIIPFLVAGLAIFLIFSCATRETNPVSPDTDISEFEPDANPQGFFNLTAYPNGGPLDAPVGEAVIDNDDPEARISMAFDTRMDEATMSAGITLTTTGGSSVALDFSYSLGSITTVSVRPAADLSHNTTYIFSVKGDLLANEAGDNLDVDGDEVAGESPDDYLTYRFTTIDEDGFPGVPEVNTTDDLPPDVGAVEFFLPDVNGDDSTLDVVAYVDANIRWFVYDYYRDELGATELGGLPASRFTTSTVIVRDFVTKEGVAGTVTYDSVDTSPYWRVAFNPSSNLLPGHDYEIVLKAQEITDAAGNKLDETGDLSNPFRTIGMTSDGTVSKEDITPPTVVSSYDGGSYLYIDFSEEIDPATINAASIEMTHNEEPYAGYFEITIREWAGSPVTRVVFRPFTVYPSGNKAYVRPWMIKDLAGNVMSTGWDRDW